MYDGLPGAVCDDTLSRRSVSRLEFHARVDRPQRTDITEKDGARGGEWKTSCMICM